MERSKVTKGNQNPLLKHKGKVTTAESTQQTPYSIQEMQTSFGKLVTKTLESLKDRVTVKEFASTLLALGAYEPVMKKEDALLEDHEERLFAAQTISDIHRVIHPYMSFFNPELLAYVIEIHGMPTDHEDFEEYMSKLEAFCQGIINPPMDLSSKEHSVTKNREEIVVKLDLKDKRLQRLRNVKSSIAKILGVKEVTLCIVSIQEGCTEVVFMVPQFVVKQLFPLLEEQIQAISSLGVLQLTTSNGHQYDLKVSSVMLYMCLWWVSEDP